MKLLTAQEWEHFLKNMPNPHLLQTAAWGELKKAFGWEPIYLVKGQTGALILFRKLALGYHIAYIPKGPVGENWGALWPDVDTLCQQKKTVFLKVEPDLWEPIPEKALSEKLPGFIKSAHTIQPPRTILIDLKESEENILMRMKSKTRYNIRLAGRKDVVVQKSADVKAFHQMMLTTGSRDEFGIHSLNYYQKAYACFAPQDACALFIATYQDKPLAGLMAFAHGDTAWYFYGASTNQERNRMPTYLIQWKAIQWAKARGCRFYDMWGIPDFPEDVLEEKFTERSDGLWGVYRFKRGFGGEVRRAVGAWDRVYHPLLYRLYQVWVKRQQNLAA